MSHPARVYWLSPAAGGRARPVDATTYSTVAVLPETGWPHEAWSVVLDFPLPPAEQGNPSTGTIRFLVDAGPADALHPGRILELVEGPRVVAVVEILARP